MSVPVTVWEALPETNRRNDDGNLIIKRPEGRLKLFRKENIFTCCGRAFLTIQSLENHAEKDCLMLECNADLRPNDYDEICEPGHLTNLLVKNEVKIARLKYIEKLKSSLPNAVVVVERLQLPLPKQEPIELMSPNSLEDGADMPHLSPIKKSEDCDDSMATLSESSSIEPPVIEPIIPLFAMPDKDVEVHIVRHECKICSYISKFAVNLRNHYKREHPRFIKRRSENSKNVGINKKNPKLSTPNYQKQNSKKKSIISSNSGKKVGRNICKLCGFAAKVNLKRHMKVAHVQNSDYKCQYCGCSFASKFGLRTHISSVHKIKRSAKRIKSKRIRTEDRSLNTKDIKTFVGKFSCSLCTLKFTSKFFWKSHLKNAHVYGNAFSCRFCTCSFRTKIALGTHVSYHHKRKSAQLHSKLIQFNKSKSSDKSSGGINCHICGKYLKSKCFLSIHTQVCHVPNGQPCTFCPCKFSTDQSLKTHITRQHVGRKKANDGSKSFVKLKKTRLSDKIEHKEEEATKEILKCPEPECKCPILDQETLKLHMKLEHATKENCSKKTFNCHFCLECFETTSDRDIHMKKEHEKWQRLIHQGHSKNKRPIALTCDLCPTKIYYVMQLKFHLKTAHDPSFTHKCPSCSCRFQKEKGLKYHVAKNHRNHTSEKLEDKNNTICNLCNRPMHTISNLKRHLQRAHVKNGKYECKFCPCRYGLQISLEQHVAKAHKKEVGRKEEHLCNMCDFKTRHSEELKSHMKKAHVRDGRYFCTMCSCRFSESSQLTFHMTRKHNVVNYKIINCDLCSIEVYSQQGLSVHKKLAHIPGGIACSYCPCTFDSKSYLDDHLKKDHSDIRNKNVPGVRACRLIPPVYTVPQLYNENASAKEAKTKSLTIPCRKCDAMFQIPYQLKDHMKRCHAEENHASCPYCPCVFANELGMKIHITNRHNKIYKRRISPSKSDVEEINPGNKLENLPTPAKKCKLDDVVEVLETIKSHQSPEKSKLELDLVRHKDQSGDTSSDDVVELKSVINVQRSPLKGENNGSSPTKITCRCKKCGTVFRSMENLLDHLKNAHGVNSLFKCSVCDATFVNPILLTKHLVIHASSENIHSPKKAKRKITENEFVEKLIKKTVETFTCKRCSSPFDSLIELGLHMQMKHGTNGIECKFCSSSFDSNTDLTIHHTIYHYDEKELFSGTTITLKGNGASAIGSHFEHTFVKNDVLNTQITSTQENALNLDRISITALDLDQISNSILQNEPYEVECETLHKDINLEEEFPTVFEYIMDEDRNSLIEVNSLQNTSLQNSICGETIAFETLQELIDIEAERSNTFEIIDLTNENPKNSCEFIDLTIEISNDSSNVDLASPSCNEFRKTLQTRRESTPLLLKTVQLPTSDNFEGFIKNRETESTRFSQIFGVGSNDDIYRQKKNTEAKGDDCLSNHVDRNNSLQNDDDGIAAHESMTHFQNNGLSSSELEELLTKPTVLSVTTKELETKDANYPTYNNWQRNFDVLCKETVFREADVVAIDAESKDGAEGCLHNYERTFSEASTDYEDECSDVDYSDVCFRCGEVVLNRRCHEMSCSVMDFDGGSEAETAKIGF